MVENRKHLRVQFGFQVEDKSGKKKWMTDDISVGGCFLKAVESMTVGSKIDLVLQLPGSTQYIEAVGEVKHTKESGMGVQFITMDNEERAEVDRFVQDVHQFSDKHS